MLTLHLDPRFLITALFQVLFGMSAGLAAMPAALKWKMLSFNKDGYAIVVVGLAAIVVGLFYRDYTGAYTLTLVGQFVALLGIWIALPDRITNRILNFRAMWYYLAAFVASVIFGSTMRPADMGLVLYYVQNLTLPVAGTSLLAALLFLIVTSDEFKSSVLAFDTGGWRVILTGVVALIATLFVGANPAFVIALSVLGCGFVALGGLIALPDKVTNFLLKPWLIPVYGVGMWVLLVLSRAAF